MNKFNSWLYTVGNPISPLAATTATQRRAAHISPSITLNTNSSGGNYYPSPRFMGTARPADLGRNPGTRWDPSSLPLSGVVSNSLTGKTSEMAGKAGRREHITNPICLFLCCPIQFVPTLRGAAD